MLSDVHGNAVALRVVLEDLERRPVDQVVCLGDMLQGGPEPVAVADLLAAHGWPVVLGNADAFLLDPAAGREPATDALLEVRAWTVSQLGARLDLIRSFAPTVQADLGGGRTLLAFHGSPLSYDDILLPGTAERVFRTLIGDADADVLAGGHVHVQFLRRLGASVFVNPGSIGLSYDHEQGSGDFRADRWAAYAVVEVEDGRVEVAFRCVPLDVDELVRAALASGMPHADEAAHRWR